MPNIIYQRQQIVTGSGSIVGTTFQGVKSVDFISTPNSSYQITESCKMTLHSNPTVGDKVAFWLTSTANFDIVSTDKINGQVLPSGFGNRVKQFYTIIILTYSGSTNGWQWESRDNGFIKEVQISDPYFDSVLLYLRGKGQNNSTQIIDSSSYSRTVSRSGNPVISTAQSKYNGSSIYFDGSSRLSIPDSAEFAFLANPFTIEGWIYPTVNSKYFFGKGDASSANGSEFSFSYGLGFGLFAYFSNANTNTLPVQTFTLNQWQHFAYVRNGTSIIVYVNGVAFATATLPANAVLNNTVQPLLVGGYGTNSMVGYLYLRISNIARYTANFNPETDTWFV